MTLFALATCQLASADRFTNGPRTLGALGLAIGLSIAILLVASLNDLPRGRPWNRGGSGDSGHGLLDIALAPTGLGRSFVRLYSRTALPAFLLSFGVGVFICLMAATDLVALGLMAALILVFIRWGTVAGAAGALLGTTAAAVYVDLIDVVFLGLIGVVHVDLIDVVSVDLIDVVSVDLIDSWANDTALVIFWAVAWASSIACVGAGRLLLRLVRRLRGTANQPSPA